MMNISNSYFFRAAMASRIPSTTPNKAAHNARMLPGNINVIVWAGNQNNGIVFLNTKFHCTSQFRLRIISLMRIGRKKPFNVPPLFIICVSVILCSVMNTGPNSVFINTETMNATNSFPHDRSPAKTACALSIPIYWRNVGTPDEKTIIAALIPKPSIPHTIARGRTPNPGLIYFPVAIRSPISSPAVDNMANLANAAIMPCEALNDWYAPRTVSLMKNGRNNNTAQAMKIKSCLFMSFLVFDLGLIYFAGKDNELV